MIAPARIAAYEILLAVAAGRVDLPSAIASARGSLRDDRDRALAADVATGVQRHRAALDHIIAALSRRKIDRLDPQILEILRLSAYQLLHHSRVPASAVVDDAVDLARRAGKRSATGFVNAVLRAMSRTRASLSLPGRPTDPADRPAALDYLSTTLSHPRWLVSRWYDRMGFAATEAWLLFNNSPAALTLRANTLRTSREDLVEHLSRHGVRLHPTRFAPDGVVVDEGQPLAGEAGAGGRFVVQDEASQLVALLAASRPGRRALDTCASPGGKTTAIAAAMQNEGLLVACDVRSRRMRLLRRTIAASGARNVRLVQADLLVPLPFASTFDSVVVDAPCSGLGVLRRDPDLRWRRREADLPALAAAQLRMLQHAAQAVGAGGRLIYATCSSEPEENEAIADQFLAATPRFVAVHAREAAPALPGTLVDGRGHLRTLPHVHALDAFFGAAFERRH